MRLDANYSANKKRFDSLRKCDFRMIDKNEIYMNHLRNNNNNNNNCIKNFDGEKIIKGIGGKIN